MLQPTIFGVGLRSGCYLDQNLIKRAREFGEWTSFVCWCRRGYLGSQTGKIVRIGHFQAKSICYSPWFLGWTRGAGVIWAKIRLGHAREAGKWPSVVRLCGRAICVVKRAK